MGLEYSYKARDNGQQKETDMQRDTLRQVGNVRDEVQALRSGTG
jgi:hypothetical protein